MAEKTEQIVCLQERERNRDWLTALIPLLLIGFVYYGWWTLALTLVGAGAYMAVAALMGHRDLLLRRIEAALVTGLLVTFCLPVTTPVWVVGLACGVAALLTAGVDWAGKRWHWTTAPVCPAVVGFLLARLLFPAATTAFTMPVQFVPLDGVSGATPMAALWNNTPFETTTRLFTGAHSGAIGEGCAAVILLAAVYLLLRRRVRLIAPGAMLATVCLLSWIVWNAPVYGLLTGGVMLTALLLADRAYAPTSYVGQAVVGVLTGGVIVLARAVFGTDGCGFGLLVGCLLGCFYPYLAAFCTRYLGAKAEKSAKIEK